MKESIEQPKDQVCPGTPGCLLDVQAKIQHGPTQFWLITCTLTPTLDCLASFLGICVDLWRMELCFRIGRSQAPYWHSKDSRGRGETARVWYWQIWQAYCSCVNTIICAGRKSFTKAQMTYYRDSRRMTSVLQPFARTQWSELVALHGWGIPLRTRGKAIYSPVPFWMLCISNVFWHKLH